MKKTILGFLFIGFFALFLLFNISEANAEIPFNPNVRIPGTDFGQAVIIDGDSIGNYIKSLYEYGAIFVGAVAMFMLVFAGWQWLMAAGSADKIGRAKETINGVLIGLILLFGGYLLLSQISTNLVQFKSLTINAPELNTTDDENCTQMNNKIKSLPVGSPDLPADVRAARINPSNISACGTMYAMHTKYNEDGTPDVSSEVINCMYNIASRDSDDCMARKSGEKLYDGQCSSRPVPGYECTQLSGDCDWIWANRSGDKCEKYWRKDFCMSNYCHSKHTAYECGLDQNNPKQKCEELDDVWCNSSEYCDYDGSNKWCCESGGGNGDCAIDENASSDRDQTHINNCRYP